MDKTKDECRANYRINKFDKALMKETLPDVQVVREALHDMVIRINPTERDMLFDVDVFSEEVDH